MLKIIRLKEEGQSAMIAESKLNKWR